MGLRRLFLFAWLAALVPASFAADEADRALESDSVVLVRAVYFQDANGAPLRVEPGSYSVLPGEEIIALLGAGQEESITIRATIGSHDEDIVDDVAISVAGSQEEPDAHFIVLMFPGGKQLVAQGSYSGIQARGVLGDAARNKAAAARAAAHKAAAAAKAKARQLADQARMKKELAAGRLRARARQNLGELMQEIATIQASGDRAAAAKKALLYSPRLAAASLAATTPAQRREILALGRRELEALRPFVEEVTRRLKTVAQTIVNSKGRLGQADRERVLRAIQGDGDNALIHPFASRTVTRRGTASGFNPSWSIGVAGEVSGVVGLVLSGTQAFHWNILEPGTCEYGSIGVDTGAQGEGEVQASVGFYPGSYDALGASSLQGWLDGVEIAVGFGVSYAGGIDVTLSFGVTNEWLMGQGPLRAQFSGVQIALSGGGGGEAAAGLSYGVRGRCEPPL